MPSGPPGQDSAIAAGIAAAAAILLAAYLALRHLALRLPYPLFFGGTAVLLYCMAIVFMGQGIIELQAAGNLGSFHLAGVPHISWLGMAPTAQGLGAQGLMLLLPVLAWSWRQRRPALA